MHQTEHMTTIEAHAVSQQVHVATFTEHNMLSADEDSPSSPDDDIYDDSDILNSAGQDEVTAHLAAAGEEPSQWEDRGFGLASVVGLDETVSLPEVKGGVGCLSALFALVLTCH